MASLRSVEIRAWDKLAPDRMEELDGERQMNHLAFNRTISVRSYLLLSFSPLFAVAVSPSLCLLVSVSVEGVTADPKVCETHAHSSCYVLSSPKKQWTPTSHRKMNTNERELFLRTLALSKNTEELRLDGRIAMESRKVDIRFHRTARSFLTVDSIMSDQQHSDCDRYADNLEEQHRVLQHNSTHCNAVCEVSFGDSKVIACVSAEIVEPHSNRPNEGFLHLTMNLNPMASGEAHQPFGFGNSFLNQSSAKGQMQTSAERWATKISLEASSIVEMAVKDSQCVDLEALCVSSGKKVWKIHCEVNVLNYEGTISDVASLAAIGALSHFRIPEVSLVGETTQLPQRNQTVERDIRVVPFEEAEPVPLSIIHWPIVITFGIVHVKREAVEVRSSNNQNENENQNQTNTANGNKKTKKVEKTVVLLDPTDIEEQMLDGMIYIVMNEHGDICTLEKKGWPLVSSNLLERCCEVAEQVAKQRLAHLLDQD